MVQDKTKAENAGPDTRIRVNPIPFYGSVIGITAFAFWANAELYILVLSLITKPFTCIVIDDVVRERSLKTSF